MVQDTKFLENKNLGSVKDPKKSGPNEPRCQ